MLSQMTKIARVAPYLPGFFIFMGCDIHMRAEIRKNNKWEILGDIFKNPWYSPERPKTDWNREFTQEPYSGRNYDLFAILADVRNGRGFAGIKTGDGFNPISDPKGIPSDASREGKEFMNEYGVDGHSHSYFTVRELLDYDWNQLTGKRGVISLDQYKVLRGTGECPESWCGVVSGPGIATVNETMADTILDTGQGQDALEIYVDYHWGDTYRSRAADFLNETLPALEQLGGPEDIRIIFFFDN